MTSLKELTQENNAHWFYEDSITRYQNQMKTLQGKKKKTDFRPISLVNVNIEIFNKY